MAREWCVFVDAASPNAASSAAQLLSLYHFEAESTDGGVLCFAESRERAQTLARRVDVVLREAEYPDELGQARVCCWDEEAQRYVDPDAPDEPVEPQQLGPTLQYRVRVRFERFLDRGRAGVRAIRPGAVIDVGLRYVDFLADDDADAQSLAMQVRGEPGVRSVSVDPIKGWFRRWLLRERLAGNYWSSGGSGNSWW